MDRDASSTYYIGFDGWNQTNKPYLVVSYTYTSPYSWLRVNGSGSASGTVEAGQSQQITVGFETGALATGTYNANIRLTSNDPVDPQVLVPCTLTVAAFPLTRTWTGAVDEKWNRDGNWSPGGVPGPSDDVIVPASATVMPEVKVSGMTCNNVTVKPGANLIVTPGFILTVNGTITIEQ